MPKPNVNVVTALFESYLTMRQTDWQVEELPNGKLKLPAPNSWEGKKIAVCYEMLQKISKAKSIDDWINVAIDLYDHERKQKALFASQWIGRSHALLDVLRAIRCYIINCMAKEERFKTCVTTLQGLQVLHESDVMRLKEFKDGHSPKELLESEGELAKTNKQLKSLRVKADYLNDFFTLQIVVNDVKYAELKEADVNEYVKNVEEGKRPGILCKKMMDSMSVVLQAPANSNAPAPSSTNAAPEAANIAPPAPNNTSGKAAEADLTLTDTFKTPIAIKSTKEQRSALRANSKFAEPAATAMNNEPPQAPVKKSQHHGDGASGYNTRSKTRNKHN